MIQIDGRNAEEIVVCIQAALADGRATPGLRLPTVRELATSLGISTATVAAAYRELRWRGLVSTHRRGGTRLTSRAAFTPRLSRIDAPVGLVDLASGHPDPALLPALDLAFGHLREPTRLYDGPSVHPALERLARAEFEAEGLPAQAIAVVHGGLQALALTLRTCTTPGDLVALEDPLAPPVRHLVQSLRLVPVPVPVDDEGMDPAALSEALRRGARAAVWCLRAQNPTGATFGPERAAAMATALSVRRDVVVIETDHMGPVAGVTCVSPGVLAGHPRHVVIRSVSKWLGPDLRIAVMAGDDETIGRVERQQALEARWASHVLQQAVAALWGSPAVVRLLARAADTYGTRRLRLVEALARHGVQASQGHGFNLWIPAGEEAGAVRDLAASGWAVAPGEAFRLRSGLGIRVTAATLDAAGAERLAGDVSRALRPSAGRLA